MNNEDTARISGDQRPGWYATRVWHSINGELTCARLYVPYERREDPEHLQ